jgi:hypothetical protein
MERQQKSIRIGIAIMGFVAMGFFVFPGMLRSERTPSPWSQILPASQRFQEVMNGAAVLDKETRLVWAKDANLGGMRTWELAITYCQNLSIGGRKGWRLPSAAELASLVDPTTTNPALPGGHPFCCVQPDNYWSATPHPGHTDSAYFHVMNRGVANFTDKSTIFYVWPVRGGN